MDKTIKIVVVEDHHVTLSGLESELSRHPEFSVVGTAYTSNDGLSVVRQTRPDVILLDLHLPGSDGPRTMVEKFHSLGCGNILIFSAETGNAFVQAVLKAGAAGYLIKSEMPERIVEAIKNVAAGQTRVLSPSLVSRNAQRLTKAEQHILALLAQGKKYNDIADLRCTSPATIRRQCDMLQSKLNLNTREELIAWAVGNGYNNLD